MINRPQEVQKIMLGDAEVGNDNPFWKHFASTDQSIHQRVAQSVDIHDTTRCEVQHGFP